MKDSSKKANRYKTIGIVCAVVAIIALVVFGILFATGTIGDKYTKVEKQLKVRLTEIGRQFYEDYYYVQVGKDESSRKEFIKDHSKDGIKINLANLARTNTVQTQAILDEFKNADGVACNANNTRVSIYPKEPYGVKDYDIEVDLDCGGNKTTKKTEKKDVTTTIETTSSLKTTKKKVK